MSKIIKDNKNKPIKIFYTINDMAYERKDAIDRCASLGEQFINHFNKILIDRSEKTKLHHAKEMQSYLDKVCQIVLKQDHKLISYDQLIDWFFTKGSSLEIIFGNDNNAIEKYNEFLRKIGSNYDVYQTLKDIKLLK